MKSIKYRAVTLLLCVAFLCTLWPVSSFAAIEDITATLELITDFLNNTYGVSSDCTCGTEDGTHAENCPEYVSSESDNSESDTVESETVEPETNEPETVADDNIETDSAGFALCDCEYPPETMSQHSDSCARKSALKSYITENTAEDIYCDWFDFDETVQSDISDMLSVYDSNKYEALNELLSQDEEPEEDPEEDEMKVYEGGTKNNVTVNAYAASGVFPENTDIQISEADVSQNVVETAITSVPDFSDFDLYKIYAVDISFLTEDETEIQPKGSVYVNFNVQIPSDVDSSKVNSIVIVHIGNNGVAEVVGTSYIDSFAIEQNITVCVDSFSTYVVALGNKKYQSTLMSDKLVEENNTRYKIVTFPVTLNDFDAVAYNDVFNENGLRFTTGDGTWNNTYGVNGGAAAATQGIVKKQLKDGYPVTYSDDRGKVLFGTDSASYKTSYSNVDFEFIYDSDSGYYTYNSGANHAQYNSTKNSVELYADTLAPFNYYFDIKNNITANTNYATLTNQTNGNILIKVKEPTSNNMFRITDSDFTDRNTDEYTHMYLRLKSNYSGTIKCRVFYSQTDYGTGSDYDTYSLSLEEGSWADYVFGPFDTGKTVRYVRFYFSDVIAGTSVEISLAGVLRTNNPTDVNFAGLYPFNDITSTFAGSEVFDFNEWKDLIDSGINAELLSTRVIYNSTNTTTSLSDQYAYFTMSMELDFYIPADGKLDGKEDIVFEFNGDDDMWVFVDGELALDIGGCHTAVNGSINFTAGTTYVSKARQLTGLDSNTDPKENVYGTLTKEQYTTGEYHTLKIFYMERAGTNSNCLIKFNLPVVPTGNVVVSKTVTEQNSQSLDNTGLDSLDFTFTAKVNGALYSNKSYTVVTKDSDGKAISQDNRTTGDDGTFTLKHNQTAYFNGIDENSSVEITESTPANNSNYKYVSTTVNNSTTTSGSGTTSANDILSFDFVNTYCKSVADLTISKSGADLDLDPNQSFIFTVVCEDNNINMTVVINGNGSVTIKDLPVGNYTVTEDESWSWRYSVDGANPKTITVSSSGTNTVEFKNERDKDPWLDGNAYAENIFTEISTNVN